MKKVINTSVFALALFLSGSALATGLPAQAGGFDGPGVEPTTVAEALKMGDDTPVVLIGRIERSLGDENYLFKDASGTTTIEIDDEDWRGLKVTPSDTVEIKGEVDKDLFRTKIDVEAIMLKTK